MDDLDLTDLHLGAHHVLLRPIGRGASGRVWEAVDERTGEHVAAKVLRPEFADDHAVVAGFLAERGMLVGLRHPSIVAVRDLVAEGGRLAILMDLMDGGSLRGALDERGTLPPTDVAGVLVQVLDALAHAQVAGVQHRDVKPDNVLLTADWEALAPGSVKLADFGVARLVEQNRHLSTGILGTPEYMSPELITTGRSGFPADVYAAGVLGYELLAGRTPFAGPGNDYSVAHRQVNLEPPRLRVPGPLWRLLASMLAKDPAERPTAASAAAALRALTGSLDGVGALAPQAPVEDFRAAERPGTVLWGQAPAAAAEPVVRSVGAEDLPDLGQMSGATILRPVTPREPVSIPVAPAARKPWWRRWWALSGLAAVLVGAVIAAVVLWPRSSTAPSGPVVAENPTAMQNDQQLPTGLGVSRQATYDPGQRLVRLTITYTAQRAPLQGPFLEVVPGGAGEDCPVAVWSGATATRNLPTVTGISVECGWAVALDVPAKGSRTVTAAIPMELGSDRQALQGWLDAEAEATQQAVTDRQVAGAAYPVQRLQSIQVKTPSRVLTGDVVRVDLVPVWPSGPDPVSPLFRSPATGGATTTLTAIAGGTTMVRLTDGCGQTTVSRDGLVVTALTMTNQCTVNASVGNMTDLVSNTFAVATRGR